MAILQKDMEIITNLWTSMIKTNVNIFYVNACTIKDMNSSKFLYKF